MQIVNKPTAELKPYDKNAEVLQEHFDKYEIPNPEFIAMVQEKMNTMRGLDDFIDDLLNGKGAKKFNSQKNKMISIINKSRRNV